MKKALPLIIIAAAAGLVLFLVAGMGNFKTEAEPFDMVLPEKWQEYNRTALAEGDEALKLFQTEHEKKIPFRKAIRGEYSDGTNQFTIWVAGGTSDGNASQMLVDMSNKIGTAHKTFSEPKPLDVGGVTVYRTQGQEKNNFFYVKGARVYWLGIKSADPEGLLKQIVPAF